MTGAGPGGGMTPIWPFGTLTGGRTLTVLPASVVRDISASVGGFSKQPVSARPRHARRIIPSLFFICRYL